MQIIGIDYSSNPKNVGFALGTVSNDRCSIESVYAGSNCDENIKLVTDWLSSTASSLICIDAPLGWPEAMRSNLNSHSAGDVISEKADKMFQRETDSKVRECLDKKPLEVGANLIARTAHSALSYIDKLRKQSGLTIPLSWSPENNKASQIIEVYPAATLTAYKIKSTGYKDKDKKEERKEIIHKLGKTINLSADKSKMIDNANVLDAVICVLAGFDFISEVCKKPVDLKLAQKEGWIWFKRAE